MSVVLTLGGLSSKDGSIESGIRSLSMTDFVPESTPPTFISDIGVQEEQQFNLTPGVNVILGGTESGKTTYAKHILQRALKENNLKGDYINFVEEVTWPEVAISDELELHQKISDFLESDLDYLFIDSFRFYIYNSRGGSTGKGGQNMSIYAELTALDNVVNRYGKMLFILFNPLSADDEAYESVKDNIKASVKGTFIVDKNRQLVVNLRGNGKKRGDVSFRIPDVDSLPDVKSEPEVVGPQPEVAIEVGTPDSSSAQIIKRILK